MKTGCSRIHGSQENQGNKLNINLEPDTRTETDELFKGSGEGGKVEVPLQVMFWGDYFG